MIDRLIDPNARVVLAHRGNRVAAPENTIESFRQADELGVDAIELDVRVTRDGVPVVIHDDSVDRTTNGRGLVESFTFAELRALDAGARSPVKSVPMPIPSLEEVLDRFRRTPLIIEVKEVAAVEATQQMIRRFGASDRVLVGSAVTEVMERFYPTEFWSCASFRDATRLIPIALAGLTPAVPSYDVLSVTTHYRGFPIPVIRMAVAARKVGIPTHVWTINDPLVARRLWNGGVSGIVTDDPAAMLRARTP